MKVYDTSEAEKRFTQVCEEIGLGDFERIKLVGELRVELAKHTNNIMHAVNNRYTGEYLEYKVTESTMGAVAERLDRMCKLDGVDLHFPAVKITDHLSY